MTLSFGVIFHPVGGVYLTIPNFSVREKVVGGMNAKIIVKVQKQRLNL